MQYLEKLKSTKSLSDVAQMLGFKPAALSYLLYKKPENLRYNHFEIPKATGGMRKISSPTSELKKLQRRLSGHLQHCIDEINESREITTTLSHGFRPKYSIITNARVHRNKRFVLNVDLENFFHTIHFGRVRGFFIKNKNFNLSPSVATILAQIACHKGSLPQGSPCSPVISNLITHVLDIRLAQLAKKTGCQYSRYADDLTFSTNKSVFPSKVANDASEQNHWEIGKELSRIIRRTDFQINPKKTRMQLSISRQDVTGLIVNSKVNTRCEYRHLARAMVHRLLNKGSFQIKAVEKDGEGNFTTKKVAGTLDQLNGILSFIDSVSHFQPDHLKGKKQEPQNKESKVSAQNLVYRNFLFFKNFYKVKGPVIVFEGKTDNVYLRSAIRQLAKKFPALAKIEKDKSIKLNVRLFQYSSTTSRIMGLSGGSGDLGKFIWAYRKFASKLKIEGMQHPIILLIDNDSGAKGIYKSILTITKKKVKKDQPFFHLGGNLYVIPTPLGKSGEDTMIEDFFEDKVRRIKVNGKTLNLSGKGFDSNSEYGKSVFATQVVKKNEKKISFAGFCDILERIQDVVNFHNKSLSGK